MKMASSLWGSTKEELKERTVKVLKKIIDRSSGPKRNKTKCIIGVESVTSLGHTFSANSVSPDPEQVKAINEMSTYTENESWPSTIPRHDSILNKVYPKLVKWDCHTTRVDQERHSVGVHKQPSCTSQQSQSQNISLKFFDPHLPTKVICDSSKVGLGATLEQKHEDENPAVFPVFFCAVIRKRAADCIVVN